MENVLIIVKHKVVVKQKNVTCINCMGRGNNTDIDHTTYDRDCLSYVAEKTIVKNNTDHGFS